MGQNKAWSRGAFRRNGRCDSPQCGVMCDVLLLASWHHSRSQIIHGLVPPPPSIQHVHASCRGSNPRITPRKGWRGGRLIIDERRRRSSPCAPTYLEQTCKISSFLISTPSDWARHQCDEPYMAFLPHNYCIHWVASGGGLRAQSLNSSLFSDTGEVATAVEVQYYHPPAKWDTGYKGPNVCGVSLSRPIRKKKRQNRARQNQNHGLRHHHIRAE
mmetsp:Transcript_28554/g.87375  ORF Transcript_28554/g.87375 Transcript_28554/m.87375 type:complete len:215 (+) Transcript_28554:915-1559(+)